MSYTLYASNISFSYKKKNIFNNLSFGLSENELLTILGPNGAGKTTLLKCLLGLNKISNGSISLYNKDINSYSTKEFSKLISFVPQQVLGFSTISVEDFLIMGRAPYISLLSKPSKNDLLKVSEIIQLLSLENLIHKKLIQLSGGELQKVYIAKALVQDTRIIFMDEPTSALDVKRQLDVFKLLNRLKSLNKTVIITTHDLNFALRQNGKSLILGDNFQLYGDSKKIITKENIKLIYNIDVNTYEFGGEKIVYF